MIFPIHFLQKTKEPRFGRCFTIHFSTSYTIHNCNFTRYTVTPPKNLTSQTTTISKCISLLHDKTWFPLSYSHSIYGTGIFTYIYHKNQPNVGKYTIHGWYGIRFPGFFSPFSSLRRGLLEDPGAKILIFIGRWVKQYLGWAIDRKRIFHRDPRGCLGDLFKMGPY